MLNDTYTYTYIYTYYTYKQRKERDTLCSNSKTIVLGRRDKEIHISLKDSESLLMGGGLFYASNKKPALHVGSHSLSEGKIQNISM